MSAASAVLSGPNCLSNNSPRTCARTCGQTSRAAVSNSSSIVGGGPPSPSLDPNSTHSPYGSGLSLGSIGFMSCSVDLGQKEACHRVMRYVNSTEHNYPYREDFFLLFPFSMFPSK